MKTNFSTFSLHWDLSKSGVYVSAHGREPFKRRPRFPEGSCPNFPLIFVSGSIVYGSISKTHITSDEAYANYENWQGGVSGHVSYSELALTERLN